MSLREKSQLIVYHFMFGPDDKAGCPGCSFLADNFNGIDTHLKHRDTSFLAISRAPLPNLEAYKQGMGWNFKWVLSNGNDFNLITTRRLRRKKLRTERPIGTFSKQEPGSTEVVGISAFYKDPDGQIFHIYSCFQRGVEHDEWRI